MGYWILTSREMISRTVTDAVVAYLVDQDTEGLSYVATEAVSDKAFPLVIVEATGMSEHEVLVGVYTLTVEVRAVFNPERSTPAEMDAATTALYGTLGDVTGLRDALHATSGLKCWDARRTEQVTAAEDGYQVTRYAMEIVAAEE